MDFTDEEQNSSSIRFQYSCISVDKSALQDGHWPSSKFNIQLDLDKSCLLTISFSFYVILNRSFTTTCSMARCIIILINVVITTNFLLNHWMRKVSKNLSVFLVLYLTINAISATKFARSPQAVISLYVIGIEPNKFLHHLFVQCSFVIWDWLSNHT